MRALFAGTAISAAATLPAAAQNATWLANPGTNNYNTAANWNPAAVPTGTATFGNSNRTALSISANTTLNAWKFNIGAPAYSFNIGTGIGLTFNPGVSGGGIIIQGNSDVNIINNGTLTFSGNSNPGNNVNAGHTFITTAAGAVTAFDDSGGVGNTSGGTAQFITQAGGTFDISKTAATTFDAASIEGAGNYIIGNKIFSVGSNDASTEVSGVISGIGGRLAKVGAGTLTLSGVSTYTGDTFVNQGTLLVNGSIASSSQIVIQGGTLGGIGQVSSIALMGVGSTFAPGSGVAGTSMNVNGSLAFQSGTIYLVQLNPTSASHANVTGSAALAGTVNAQFAPGAYVAHSYTILSSAGGFGGTTFGTLTTTPGFTAHLSYGNNDVILNLDAALGAGCGGGGIAGTLNSNQQNVANAINTFFNNGGALPPAFVSLFGLSGPALGAALTQVSGETATGTQQTTFNAMGQFMGLLTDPFIGERGAGATGGAGGTPFAEEGDTSANAANGKPRTKNERDAYAMFTKTPPAPSFAQHWSVWGAGFGGSQTATGNATLGSNNTSSRLGAVAVGADYRFSPFTIAGFALAGGGTNFSVANGGTGRSDLFQAGAFVRHNVGPAYISAALAYGWQDITTDRTVTVAGVDQLRAKFNANAYSGRVEGGYRFVTPWNGGIGITPYAAGQFTTFDLPAYAEQAIVGSNQFALGYGAKSVTDTRSELGIRTDKSWAMQSAILTLRGRAAWAHDFNPDRNIGATFQALPGASFVVNGAAQAHDSALTTASAELKWQNGWSAAATFEGEFSNVTRSYAGKGVVRYTW
jgi:autotransporter-associated beta strand protein